MESSISEEPLSNAGHFQDQAGTSKSIKDLDLSKCNSCTPSYRLLPTNYRRPKVSHRSEIDASVLNDDCVSTWGRKNYSSKHLSRTKYEDALLRIEDARCELDVLLNSLRSTAKRVEDLMKSMIHNNTNSPICIEENFTSNHLRCIMRLYGNHGLDVLDILGKNPVFVMRAILPRLNQKHDEWMECRTDFNKVFAEVYDTNHHDFKDQDFNNLTPKALIGEIKGIKENMQKEDDKLLLAIAGGNNRDLVPNLEYEYSDGDIHEDLYKLIKCSCKKLVTNEKKINKVMRLWTNFLEPMLGLTGRVRVPQVIDEGSAPSSESDNGSGESINKEEAEFVADDDDKSDITFESVGDNEMQYSNGGVTILPFFLRPSSAKPPLTKYVAPLDSRVFYGNDDFYVLLRLHRSLYESLLSAKTNSASSGSESEKSSNDDMASNPFASLMKALYYLRGGSSENSDFENYCQTILGNQSYVLFTVDKLISKLVEQLEAVASYEMDNKLLQLYDYEKSRSPSKFVDSVYHDNARVILDYEDNIYRFEFSSSPARLSIQLMDNGNDDEKSKMVALSIEPKFAAYLYNDFLLDLSSSKIAQGIMLQRNKRKYAGLDEYLAISKAMEGVQSINGLECQIACSSSKISYVLDTEDYFFRSKNKQKKLQPNMCLKKNQSRVDRFHRFLSRSIASPDITSPSTHVPKFRRVSSPDPP